MPYDPLGFGSFRQLPSLSQELQGILVDHLNLQGVQGEVFLGQSDHLAIPLVVDGDGLMMVDGLIFMDPTNKGLDISTLV